MDAINTTLKFTKQEPRRIFALIIMHLGPDQASEARKNGVDGVVGPSIIDRMT
jgi:hypothetical protein